MKLKKSHLSIMIIITMLLTLVSSSLVYANTLDYSTSIEKMQQLGILDKCTNGDDAVVTRGQLVKAVAIADGLASTSSNLNGTTIFPDITPNSDLSGYVNGVVGSGLMFGMPDGYFHPEQEVTYAEASIIMVRLLGYTDSDTELSKLVWPNNYIQEAYNLKLSKDLVIKRNDKLTYKVEALLFDRLLDTLIKGSVTTYFSDKYFSDLYLTTDITGTLVERTILGNSKSTDNLADNQVLTDKGTYTVNSDAGTLVLGAKYKLYLDGTTITKVSVEENTVENYAVKSVSRENIYYTDDNNATQTMTLPQASAYYYHGAYIDYDAAVKDIQSYSSIILTKKSDNSGYDYGVIVDPNFGKPQIYKQDNTKLLDQIKNTKHAYIYRDANITEADLNAYDVVYFVSDIWNKNTFIYVNDKTVIGTITAFVGSKVKPTGVTINGKNYTFSLYFDRTRLNNYDGNIGNFITNTNVGDFRTLIMGVDGTIVDIY